MSATKPDLLNGPTENFQPIIDEYYKTGMVYRFSLQELGRKFLTDYFDLSFTENFAKIRRTYLTNTKLKDEDISDNEEIFFTEITKLFFSIDREPGKILFENFHNASKHLNEIDIRIKDIEDKLAKIKQENNTTAIQTDVPVLSYYLKHNKVAREEIIEFMKTGIFSYTILNSDSLSKSSFTLSVPYNYAWYPHRYEVNYPTLISNKFGNFSLKSYKETEKLYNDDRKSFQKFLEGYVNEQEVVHYIKASLSDNHIMASRKEFVLETLKAYEEKKKIVFSCMGMLMIEGIFHDVCLALGHDENDLLTEGFQEKIEFLNEKLDYKFHYEYYAFKFRVLRNKVAHGLIDQAEAQEIADLVLLDLKDAIEISRSMKIPLNQKRFFLHQAILEDKTGDFRYLIAYLMMDGIKIPDFYTPGPDHDKALALLGSHEFLSYIDQLLLGSDSEKGLSYAIISKIRGNKAFTNEKLKQDCLTRLRSNTFANLPKFDLNKFKEPLLGYVARD